jgi:hypothetical protein
MTITLRRLSFLALFAAGLGGCGSSTGPSSTLPTSPTTPAAGATVTLTGVVYVFDATGRRPLAGATVVLTESTRGSYGNPPITGANGRYVLGPVPPGHYRARATKAGYDATADVDLGYVERSRSVDFELTDAASIGAISIAGVEPNTGSTGGGTTVKVSGSGFRAGTVVTIGGEQQSAFVGTSTVIWVTTTARAAGSADVVVTSPDGTSAALAGGFAYVAAQSFDFNGHWLGYALAHPESLARSTTLHEDMQMSFTINGNVLTGVTCGGSTIVVPSPPPTVANGEFSFVGDGIAVTGRIVSADGAVGTINSSWCPATRWTAGRRP